MVTKQKRLPGAFVASHLLAHYYFPPAPSATPWAPSWSPDAEWIAISMAGSIRELTHNEEATVSPR